MKKLCCFLVFALAPLISWGQDVVATYNISQISSYLKVNRIGDATFSEIKQNIDSLREKYHSADFVIDFLDARGDYGLAAVALADSLSMLDFRMAFIVGKQTEEKRQQGRTDDSRPTRSWWPEKSIPPPFLLNFRCTKSHF